MVSSHAGKCFLHGDIALMHIGMYMVATVV